MTPEPTEFPEQITEPRAKIRARLYASVWRITARDPNRLGYWLSRHLVSERLTPAECAKRLRISEADLIELALCSCPRAESFLDDLFILSKIFGVDRTALANLIRQQQALAAWTAPPATAGAAASLTTSAEPPGWLLAAYDADQTEPQLPHPHREERLPQPPATLPSCDNGQPLRTTPEGVPEQSDESSRD
jgi:hypothetical protein